MAKRDTQPPGTPGTKDDIRSYEGPGPRLQGLLMYDTNRGQQRVRKWPRKRPGKRHPTSEFWSEWLSQGNRLYRYTPPEFQHRNREATAGTMLMPRDMFFMAARGTLATIEHPGGKIQWPAWFFWRVSDALDVFGDIPGSVLVRMEEGWAALPPGVAGDFLTSQGPGTYPVWTPGGAGGIATHPPMLTDFPEHFRPNLLIYEDGDAPGIAVVRNSTTSIGAKPGVFRPIGEDEDTWTFGMQITNPGETGRSGGVALRNSATGAWIRIHLRDASTFWGTELRVQIYNNETDASTTLVQTPINNPALLFIRVRQTAEGQITISTAPQSFGFRQRTQFDGLAHDGPYDQIGLNLQGNNAATYQSIWCFHFHPTLSTA